MIRPLPCARMWGVTSWVSRARPNKLTSNWRRASSIGTSSTEP